ncbi:hypothetical protein GM415_05070 [Pseudodesulfovibrio cashew]|uniref:Uncharacterized protein n=1 Tax=Pseudodesulfovibrio cashew TaxID=2678688 RepID=A0A6I6J9N4_9BACT|nr:hypothetical protein [Pseudodesulfovibrio cashew]QGY39516.1 hypothetical protein GM415_05070 [Pseudodesulfovibrio cashew]
MSDHINELYDKNGNLIGALLTAEAWAHVREDVLKALGLAEKPEPEPMAEPISDWQTLQEYWDFDYPVDKDVACEHCGNATEDWEADNPRRFFLTSANLAGLVAFKCVKCQSRIIKRHFKDEILTECSPYQDEKDDTKEARY